MSDQPIITLNVEYSDGTTESVDVDYSDLSFSDLNALLLSGENVLYVSGHTSEKPE